MAGSMNKYLAELLGTFVLVGIGTMAILSSGGGIVAISFGFGLALLAGIYMFGGLSGAHFNPAVTLAMLLRKDTNSSDAIGYIIAQVAGAVLPRRWCSMRRANRRWPAPGRCSGGRSTASRCSSSRPS